LQPILTMSLIKISRELCKEVSRLKFKAPVAYVYNPLEYARVPHEAYLEKWGKGPKEVLFLGMNPGPFGMAQTGVPFGDVKMVRDFLKITGKVEKPAPEHPKRLVEGFQCQRSEVSGTRLWGWVRDRFGTPENFFQKYFVVNWCPLVFMEESSRNLTPDKLPAAEREALFEACDLALERTIDELQAEWVIGVGAFAKNRAELLEKADLKVGTVLHPSPASPIANRGWAQAAEKQLKGLGVLQ
jgi:single-strand selective monofunctional uracil DNA glycosylase